MKKWIVDKQPTYISVYEEGNPDNYLIREPAKHTYGELNEITGFKIDDNVVRHAYQICDYLNEMEGCR